MSSDPAVESSQRLWAEALRRASASELARLAQWSQEMAWARRSLSYLLIAALVLLGLLTGLQQIDWRLSVALLTAMGCLAWRGLRDRRQRETTGLRLESGWTALSADAERIGAEDAPEAEAASTAMPRLLESHFSLQSAARRLQGVFMETPAASGIDAADTSWRRVFAAALEAAACEAKAFENDRRADLGMKRSVIAMWLAASACIATLSVFGLVSLWLAAIPVLVVLMIPLTGMFPNSGGDASALAQWRDAWRSREQLWTDVESAASSEESGAGWLEIQTALFSHLELEVSSRNLATHRSRPMHQRLGLNGTATPSSDSLGT